LEAFLVSTLVVALGEIGDKTQLLALLLAARFRRRCRSSPAFFAATLFNHTLAGLLGNWIRSSVAPGLLRWVLGLSFLAIAAWALIPDRIEEQDSAPMGRYGFSP